MCGIAALYKYKQLEAPDRPIRRMTDAMRHRGPDAEGHYTDDTVALGHRRLAIIDLSPLGAQPMWDVSGRYAIIFNGEIYNYKDLKASLSGYAFRSQSDTEVILAGFSTWGVSVFARLNGIFAFVLYDKAERQLYLVRDRFGIKPLYYRWSENVLAAASEIRALPALGGVAPQIHLPALADYLFNGCVGNGHSIAAGIVQLEAGYYARVSSQGLQTTPYAILSESDATPVCSSLPEVRAEVLRLFRRAVERQLMSDVPLGAFLSGGIDSSAIVAMMAELSEQAPLTFSIGFQEREFDESPYARIVAEKFKTKHTTLMLELRDFMESLPAALAAMDTPSIDGVNTYVVSKLTRQAGVTVALSGLGGDELFAGYPTFQRYTRWQRNFWWHLPQGIRRLAGIPLERYASESRMRRLGAVLKTPAYNLENVYPHFRNVLDRKMVAEFLDQTTGLVNPVEDTLRAQASDIGRFPLLSQYSLGELNAYTRNMLLKDSDQMSMASSLELRVPFFDNELVDYVLRIPDVYKCTSSPKQLLVDALGDRLPAGISQRRKMGFTLPWAQWLRGDLRDFASARIDSLCARQLLSPLEIKKLWQDFQDNRLHVQWSHVWMLVVLEEWLQRNFDQKKQENP